MSDVIDFHKAREERLARIERAAIEPHDRTREITIVPQRTFLLSPLLIVRRIKQATAEHYGITVADLEGSTRTTKIVLARRLAMYLARVAGGKSLPEIGRLFGGRHHTTVLASIRNVPQTLEEDNGTFADAVDILIAADLPREQRRAGARALVKREMP